MSRFPICRVTLKRCWCNGKGGRVTLTFLFLFSGSVYEDDLQDGMGANEREVFRPIIFSVEIVIS